MLSLPLLSLIFIRFHPLFLPFPLVCSLVLCPISLSCCSAILSFFPSFLARFSCSLSSFFPLVCFLAVLRYCRFPSPSFLALSSCSLLFVFSLCLPSCSSALLSFSLSFLTLFSCLLSCPYHSVAILLFLAIVVSSFLFPRSLFLFSFVRFFPWSAFVQFRDIVVFPFFVLFFCLLCSFFICFLFCFWVLIADQN